MEVITYEIQQQVIVRKYAVDCIRLCDVLRKHKKNSGLSNKDISDELHISITKVEHWFRKDKSFAIPDSDIWFALKKLLGIHETEFDIPICTFEEKENVFEKGNRIYDSDGIAPTITCADADLKILERFWNMEVKVIGQMDNTIDHTFESANRVYDVGGCSPTINTCGGGGLQPKILEEVQRIGNLSDSKTQSRTVYDADGVSPTLCSGMDHGNTMPHILNQTIVAMRGRNPENPSDRTVGSPTEQRLEPNSKGLCNTLTSVQKDNLVMEREIVIAKNGDKWSAAVLEPQTLTRQYRIRKLTPKECWRLMDFTDEDFNKAAQVNSNTQLYKQAGNSIVRNVLVAIIGQMISGKENVYRCQSETKNLKPGCRA